MAAQGFQKFLRPKVALSDFYHILLVKVVIAQVQRWRDKLHLSSMRGESDKEFVAIFNLPPRVIHWPPPWAWLHSLSGHA